MYLDHIRKYNIILASASPRRAFLLKEAGIKFIQRSSNADESYPPTLEKSKIAEFLADKKSTSLVNLIGDKTLLIAADTIVVLDNDVLGKPQSKHEAHTMLELLSGKTHTVYTGVCVRTKNKQVLFSVATEVLLKTLSKREIEFYIDNYSPLDKAGAYGIQEWFGYVCVEKIIGSYTNVMGLPIKELCDQLGQF